MTKPAFVHVIAIVDLSHVSGAIKYILPLSSMPESAMDQDAAGDRVWLVVRDATGCEVQRAPVAVNPTSCASLRDGADRVEGGLVQHTLRVLETAVGLDLVIDGQTVDRFDAPPDKEPAAAGGLVEVAGPMLGLAVPPSRHRSSLTDDNVAAERGVSYDVQVKPPTASTWTTLSIGRPTPAFSLDRNQFGGVGDIDLRIIRNRGFRSEVHLERRMSLREGASGIKAGQPD